MRALRGILIKKLKNKTETTQNKWVQFSLNLDKMAHISQKCVRKIKLALKKR